MSTVEGLRISFLEKAKRQTRPDLRDRKHTPTEVAHGIANQMPTLYGYFKDIDNPKTPSQDRKLCKEYIEEAALKYGFESVEDFKRALDTLRDQLKEELSESHWKAYFSNTF